MAKAELWTSVMTLLLGCGRIGFEHLPTADGGVVTDGAISDANGDATDGSMGDTGLGDAGGPPVFAPVALPPGAHADELVWAPGSVETLYVAVGDRGLFRTDDGGATWTECGLATTVRSLAAATASTVYVGDYDDLFVSTDGCTSWRSTGLGRRTESVGMAGSRILAGTNGEGLWVLEANSWRQVPTTLDDQRITRIAIAPGGSPILIGARPGGVLRSEDGGDTWADATAGLADTSVSDIVFDPTDADRVFLLNSSASGSLNRSVDGGQTWSSVWGRNGVTVAVDPGNPATVVAGGWFFAVSTAGGDGMTSVERPPEMSVSNIEALVFDPAGSGRLVASSGRGIFEATAPYTTWEGRNGDLQAWGVSGIQASPSAGMLYVCSRAGVLRSSDGGQTFSLSSAGMTKDSQCWDVVVPDTDPDALIVAGSSVWLSRDRGATFSEIHYNDGSDGWDSRGVTAWGSQVFVRTLQRILVADEPWTSWTEAAIGASPGSTRQMRALSDDSVLAAGDEGLFRSVDGLSFEPIDTTLAFHDVVELSDGSLLASTSDGVYRATTWEGPFVRVGLEDRDVGRLATRGGSVAASVYRGVYISHDDGSSWRLLRGVPEWPTLIGFDPDGNLWTGTNGFGLYRAEASDL